MEAEDLSPVRLVTELAGVVEVTRAPKSVLECGEVCLPGGSAGEAEPLGDGGLDA